jgi:hypothetical protein
VTFVRPDDASSRWAGVPEPGDAAPDAITSYFRAYGPTTFEAFGNWLAGGYFGKRQLRTWFGALEQRMAEVDVDGERTYVLAEDLEELVATSPTSAVRLLPGFDQYVLGAGTADGRVVPASRRTAVSRQAGWISPVVVVGGVVCGTWELDAEVARIVWFREAGKPPHGALKVEVARLSTILGRELRLEVVSAG